ncbi:MAG: hypothetical protein LBP53_02645 [Candidatus Peribacteria bacterium]|nr:hypothetical protein [Candidatus Peribacteria bacterium]
MKKDVCPNGDFSPSYYDKECGSHFEQGETEVKNPESDSSPAAQNEEVLTAYQWAYANDITTLPLDQADPE